MAAEEIAYTNQELSDSVTELAEKFEGCWPMQAALHGLAALYFGSDVGHIYLVQAAVGIHEMVDHVGEELERRKDVQ